MSSGQVINLRSHNAKGETVEGSYPVPKGLNRQHLMRALLVYNDPGEAIRGLTNREISWLASVVEKQEALKSTGAEVSES